ncbi:MAG TPA: hypothetical protein VGC42_17170 [Kofleriaceae bacterium]
MKSIQWGIRPRVGRRSGPWIAAAALALAVQNATVAAQPADTQGSTARPADGLQPVVPDAPARRGPVVVPAPDLPPTSNLDGIYLWLGPVGAASYVDHAWDSTFGADAAVVIVREHAPLAAYGVTLGASRWTARGGGRVWVDGLVGTHLLGELIGASLGPILELSDLAHPRYGGSIGIWGFAGITPFARLGAVSGLGMFAELGIHIDLPVLRR